MLFYFTSKVLPLQYPLKCLWYALRDKPNTHAAPSTFGPNLAVKSDNAFVHWKLSNTRTDQQLNRWVRCHSVERCRTFWKKGCWAVRPFTISVQYTDPVGGVHWMASTGPKYVERQENHSEMASGPVLYSKWGKSISNRFSVWRQENHSEMASGPVLYSKWGKSISNRFSVWRFRSHMGRNTLKMCVTREWNVAKRVKQPAF